MNFWKMTFLEDDIEVITNNIIRLTFLSRISEITDVNVLPNEHLFKILVYSSNTFNDVSNKLIITETIPIH